LAHTRIRYLSKRIQKLATLWPVVGVVGPRQAGKSTLLRDQLGIANHVTLDDEDVRADANASAKVFLSRQPRPLLIDEVQKVPKIFDAIKSEIDRKSVPGQIYLTGSSQFSARINIRESLTGRIGLVQLFPLTLGEAQGAPLKSSLGPIHPLTTKVPFDISVVSNHMMRGGMPVPMSFRDTSMITEYWKSWLDTTIYRDLSRFFKKSYDPEFAFRLLKKMSRAMAEGELPTIQHLEGGRQKLHSYLEALEMIFIVRRIPIHEKGVGRDAYLFFDSGFANFMMGNQVGEGQSLSIARHFIWQETGAYLAFAGTRDERVYYKSARGSPVDMIWDDVAIKVTHKSEPSSWDERALVAAMKSLGLKKSLVVAPTDQTYVPKGDGIGRVPWGYWS
jgi:uncharacterized protein